MEPILASVVSIIILLASRMVGMAADDTLAATQFSAGGADWAGILEKVGTVGVCIWMLVWFKGRNDTQHAELVRITERAITALEHNAESDRELAQAVTGLKEVVEDFRQ